MADEAIIRGEYVEWKMVKTRKALQLVFEVPLEHQALVQAALGTPMPDQSNPVAICRLIEDVRESKVVQLEDHRPVEDDEEPKSRPLSQVAAILCNSGAFQCFIQEESYGWDHRPTSDEAADWLRSVCGIASRTELNTNDDAAARFRKIRGQYEAWRLVA